MLSIDLFGKEEDVMANLITGGAGFLGSHIADRLIAEGEDVTVLDILNEKEAYKIAHLIGNRHFRYCQGSVLNRLLLENLIQESEKIFHFAAIVGVENYLVRPLDVLDVNIEGTKNILELAYKYKKKVIFASTSEIYGRTTNIPFKEDDERVLGPTSINRWCYSSAKAVCEHYCFGYAEKGLEVVILRFFNAYGPRLDTPESGRVISIFIGQILSGKPITIVGSGEQTRCFTYVDDVIEGIMRAANNSKAIGEVFNIGTDTETSILELAHHLIEICSKKVNIIYLSQDEYGLGYEDIYRRIPEITKARKILGFNPKYDIKTGLKFTFEWFQKNWTFLTKERLKWLKVKNEEDSSGGS
jgi:UDP-glucose 4-epimerase